MNSPAALLAGAGVPDHEARRLLAAAAGRTFLELYTGDEIDPAAATRFRELVVRRRGGEPLQYLEGEAAFGPLLLACDRRALIPRPETEGLAELAAGAAAPGAIVVDLGTGSGCVALFIKHHVPEATVIGTDASQAALELAAANSARTGLDVEWRHGDLYDALVPQMQGGVDVIVSNPPYVAAGDWEGLPTDVRHEPRAALVAGPLGTEMLAAIATGAAGWLAPGGKVLVEIGDTQGAAALALFAGFEPEVLRDAAGRDRYLRGTAP